MKEYKMPTVQFMRDLLQEAGYTNSVSWFDRAPNQPNRIEHIRKLYFDVQSRGEIDRLFACRDKEVYPTALIATKAAYHITEWRKREFEPYVCRFCGKYHVGRVDEYREERKRFYESQGQRRRTLPQG